MSRLGQPLKLPGIIGVIASRWGGGLSGLAGDIHEPERSIRNWANNISEPGAIAASKMREAAERVGAQAIHYRSDEHPGWIITSTPDGWVWWKPPQGWHRRARFHGNVRAIVRSIIESSKVPS